MQWKFIKPDDAESEDEGLDFDEDDVFNEDLEGLLNGNRVNHEGNVVGPDGNRDITEDDFFEMEEEAEGTEFMAVKPWIGAVKACEPDDPPKLEVGMPDKKLELEYVYG